MSLNKHITNLFVCNSCSPKVPSPFLHKAVCCHAWCLALRCISFCHVWETTKLYVSTCKANGWPFHVQYPDSSLHFNTWLLTIHSIAFKFQLHGLFQSENLAKNHMKRSRVSQPFYSKLKSIGMFPCHITFSNAWEFFLWQKVTYRKSFAT